MPRWSDRQCVEQFHLLFLAHLVQKLSPALFAVKGGCNLRFFLKGVRYSEDLDLDVWSVATHTLRKTVRRLFAERPLRQVLQTRGMELVDVSEPKQTDVVQRWKLGLKAAGTAQPLRTRIEFSRRPRSEEARHDPVDPEIIAAFGLPPVSSGHYPAEAAYRQKLNALATRSRTQSRDVFDLDHLLRLGVAPAAAACMPEAAARGRERALGLSFADFKSQVLVYLDPGHQRQSGTEEAWSGMLQRVSEALGEVGA